MRVEVRNKSKRLTCLVASGKTMAEADKIYDELTETEIKQLAHYDDGDNVWVMIVGGTPAVTVKKRKLWTQTK